MNGKLILTGLFLVAVLVGADPAQAQDPGAPDTVILQATTVPDFTTGQDKLTVELWVFNDEPITGATAWIVGLSRKDCQREGPQRKDSDTEDSPRGVRDAYTPAEAACRHERGR